MRYTIALYANPQHCLPVVKTALAFCQSLLNNNHSIYRLFFFSDGVLNSVAEKDISREWGEFILAQDIDACVCPASAEKHQIVASLTAPHNDSNHHKLLASGFTLGGLGQFIDAVVMSDRVITFGGESNP